MNVNTFKKEFSMITLTAITKEDVKINIEILKQNINCLETELNKQYFCTDYANEKIRRSHMLLNMIQHHYCKGLKNND